MKKKWKKMTKNFAKNLMKFGWYSLKYHRFSNIRNKRPLKVCACAKSPYFFLSGAQCCHLFFIGPTNKNNYKILLAFKGFSLYNGIFYYEIFTYKIVKKNINKTKF